MRNTFSTPEAFSAFESLLTSTSHADKGLSRTWQAFVEPDDENDDSFSQRYLLTENLVELWTLRDLTSAVEAPGARDNAQVASQEFVAVNIQVFLYTY
jgi:hypothetical protein